MNQGLSQSQENYRERLLNLTEDHERETRARDDIERELIRLVTRLCVAVSGLDTMLDPHLERLRRAAKRGGASGLLKQADELADALVHVSEDRVRPGVLQRLLERSEQGRTQADEVLQVWSAVAADPSGAHERDLDRLAELLGLATRPDAVASGGGGLFSRLLGRQPAAAGADGALHNRLLSELLGSMEWPVRLRVPVEECRARLALGSADDTWGEVLREVGTLAIDAIAEAENDSRTAQGFLAELSRHLEAFDEFMVNESGWGLASQAARERLDRSMSDEVESLSDTIRQSASLAELQAGVVASLSRMQAHVREHIEDENNRRTRAEAEADALRTRLHEVERDTFDLRRQVARSAEQALRDALTGLPNRRAYDERVAQEHARHRRFGDPLALLVLDIDDFKRINDTLGHKAGDKALVTIAGVLSRRLRETDFIARFGGEEFVLLLPGAAREDALRLADDMREAVHGCGLHASGRPVSMTVSGGLAFFAEADSADSVFERADKALYEAKGQGKNRIVAG